MFSVQRTFIIFDCCKMLGAFRVQNQLLVCRSVQMQGSTPEMLPY